MGKTKENKIISTPEKNQLQSGYEKYADIRQRIVNDLRNRIEQILTAIDSNPVISGRIKNFSSYFSKYLRLLKEGQETPLITDLMGIRIICPFIEDLDASEELINQNFFITEKEKKGHYTFREFGYESTHLLIKIPQDLIDKHGHPGTDIMEVQIRTILQDAWAEVEHELVYKADFSPFDEPMKRKLAAVNASLSLADIIFQEVRSYQRKYTREMERRRESFYQKIEESTDNLLFTQETDFIHSDRNDFTQRTNLSLDEKDSIDDLLVKALSAHNHNNFNKAIGLYTKILELHPDNEICSIIYKHRGMANFACSCYEEAISDFTSSIEFDSTAYKAAYYRGVVRSVLKQHSLAIDDYTTALKINPYQPFCLFRRAQAFYHIGDYPEALADCDNSLALEPENNSAEKFKVILHEKLKM